MQTSTHFPHAFTPRCWKLYQIIKMVKKEDLGPVSLNLTSGKAMEQIENRFQTHKEQEGDQKQSAWTYSGEMMLN